MTFRRSILEPILVFALLALAGLAFGQEAAPNGEAQRDIGIRAPTHNTDGSVLTDLVGFNLYWTVEGGSTPQEGQRHIPYTTAGGTHSERITVQVVGEFGDVVTIRYQATALDSQGNESDLSNQIQQSFRITKPAGPMPPDIDFIVPIGFECSTPEGGSCGLAEIRAG